MQTQRVHIFHMGKLRKHKHWPIWVCAAAHSLADTLKNVRLWLVLGSWFIAVEIL